VVLVLGPEVVSKGRKVIAIRRAARRSGTLGCRHPHPSKPQGSLRIA
jgi:hypothetical protein